MPDFTLHTHTIGFDGKNTPAEMASRATELGMHTIGISNHFIVHPNIRRAPMYKYAVRGGYSGIYSDSFDETIEKFRAHYDELNKLSQTSGIRILRGMEVDYFAYPAWHSGFERAVRILQPDYVIGAAHFVEYGGVLCNTHDAAHASPDDQTQMLKTYWANIRDAAASGLFTWMAHLDLYKKVGLGRNAVWHDAECDALDAIRTAGCGIEVNTGLYTAKIDEPYPSARILAAAAARDIPVLISDDAHATNQIGRHFDRAECFATSCNVKNRLNIQKILDFRTKIH
ncbi:MAG: PHP domain-containing protein [Pseudomonadota bacterium]|nr:PHP domain-containing protein [Pseudomonadota bacterium]